MCRCLKNKRMDPSCLIHGVSTKKKQTEALICSIYQEVYAVREILAKLKEPFYIGPERRTKVR